MQLKLQPVGFISMVIYYSVIFICFNKFNKYDFLLYKGHMTKHIQWESSSLRDKQNHYQLSCHMTTTNQSVL